jgi:hypothetical protein
VGPVITRRVGLDRLLDRMKAIRDRSEFSNKLLFLYA